MGNGREGGGCSGTAGKGRRKGKWGEEGVRKRVRREKGKIKRLSRRTDDKERKESKRGGEREGKESG